MALFTLLSFSYYISICKSTLSSSYIKKKLPKEIFFLLSCVLVNKSTQHYMYILYKLNVYT